MEWLLDELELVAFLLVIVDQLSVVDLAGKK
jgi:hypothetical protein